MNIGPLSAGMPEFTADHAEQLPDRIRSAHQVAIESHGESAESVQQSAVETVSGLHPIGERLVVELRTMVEIVIRSDESDPPDLLGEVIKVVVSDRFEQLELSGDFELQHKVCEKLRQDPAVVAELDDILQSIARGLAETGRTD